MDKRTAIEWLKGYICSEGTDIADTSEILSSDVDISLADATKYVTEFEELLTALFTSWLEATDEVSDEDIAAAKVRDASEEIDEEADMNDAADSAPEAEKTETEEPDTRISPDA